MVVPKVLMPWSACFGTSWTNLFSRQHITIPQLSSLRTGEGCGSLRMGCARKPQATVVLSYDPVRRRWWAARKEGGRAGAQVL